MVPDRNEENGRMEPITLSTERLVLRVLEERDIDAVHAACQDPEIPRWTPVPSPYRREHAEDFVLNTSANGWRDDIMYNFGVFTREGALVGSMGAARAVIGWGFDGLGVERLEWVAEKGNVASRAVAERLGFTVEGTLRSKIVHQGTRRDAWIGSLLPSDWDRASQTPYLPAR
jgi:RimJ/RimL family protein N-acetyltransferase